jgi:type IV pilus assembly protein PilP
VRGWILGGLLASLVVAGGCEQRSARAPSVQDYEQKRAERMQRNQNAVAQKPAPKGSAEAGQDAGIGGLEKGYTYDASNKRDPFRSFIDEQKQRLARHERGPLEQFELNQLSLVAVVWATERPRALIEDPSGRSYIVQVGTPIGKNDGTVLQIRDDTMLVRETYVDYLGAQTNKEIEMRIRSATQGG